MSRGKQLKTIVKEAVKEGACIAEAIELGKAQAEQKLHEKKPLADSLRQHIGKMIDRIDPLETVAVIGATYIIKQGINWAEQGIIQGASSGDLLKNPLLNILIPFTAIGHVIPSTPEPAQKLIEDELTKALNSPEAEVFEWVISFTLAVLIVRHFGEIVQGAGNILEMAKGLLGLAAVA